MTRWGLFSKTAISGFAAFAFAFAFAVVTVLSLSAGAQAQTTNVQPLLDRLERLERDIRTLNLQLARGNVPPPSPSPSSAASAGAATSVAPSGGGVSTSGLARLGVRLTDMEGEVRSATGRAEDLTHLMTRFNERLDKLVADVDYRLSVLETRMQIPGTAQAPATPGGPPVIRSAPMPPSVQTVPPGATPPGVLGRLTEQDMKNAGPPPGGDATGGPVNGVVQPGPVAPAVAEKKSILPEGSAKERYAFAFGLLGRADYAQAEAALSEFLVVHADDPLAANAHYWLGETFYVRGNHRKAAEIFLEGFQKNPNGSKAPDTLLKLGMSLSKLDKKRESCAAFGKLMKDMPNASASILRTVGVQLKRNECR